MPAITSANVAQTIVKLVASQALPALMPRLVMGSLVNRDFENVMSQTGDTVNVPIPPTMVANNIAEGGSVQTQNPSAGNAQIVLNTHAEASFQIPDITKALASTDLLKLYMEPAIIAIATRIETDLLSLYPNFTANTAVGTGGAGLGSESVLDKAEIALFNAYVPDTERKFLVLGTNAYGDVRQVPRFSEDYVRTGAGAAIESGQLVGKLKNFEIYRSQLVQVSGGTTYNMAFARNALALVTRPLSAPLPGTGAIAEYVSMAGFGLRVVLSYAPNTLSQQFTVDVLYGCGILRNAFGVQVLS